MNNSKNRLAISFAMLVSGSFSVLALPPRVDAQDPAAQIVETDSSQVGDEETRRRLVALLNESAFVGRFTTDGGGGNLKEERYTIESCKPGNAPELYDLRVRIQYGGKDVTAPITVRIVMADKTPVITLDQVWVPGMGTFDARVLIRDRRYAGTWKHGQRGGHLFGRIEAIKPAEPVKPTGASESAGES